MTLRRVLGLGTYPTVKPVHGGQRRVAALRRFYKSIGIDYLHGCIYDGTAYAPPLVGPHDIPLKAASSDEMPVALVGDYLSGLQSATDPESFRHFLDVVERLEPDALQLEQPFMWPLAQRLRETSGAGKLPLIYSSHNVEAPLKDAILSGAGIPLNTRRRLYGAIDAMEAEICREAALVVCVSVPEQDHYRQYRPSAEVIVVPNGVDRPPAMIPDYPPCRAVFAGAPFMFTVGSAYAPNIEGLCNYVLKDGPFMLPPVKRIAICGGVADSIISQPAYRRFLAANAARVHLFPRIEDAELWAIMEGSHGAFLPLGTGRGSSLKTAEALALGKWVVATSVAMRGYEAFLGSEGLIVADDSRSFRTAIARTLSAPPLTISDAARKVREGLYWDRCFGDSAIGGHLARL